MIPLVTTSDIGVRSSTKRAPVQAQQVTDVGSAMGVWKLRWAVSSTPLARGAPTTLFTST